MSIAFRVLLIIAAVWAFLFVINEVRKAKLQISDSLPWFFFMAIFVILALFPQIAIFFASLLGIQSHHRNSHYPHIQADTESFPA